MKHEYGEVLYHEKATYSDLFLRKNAKMRIMETVLFVIIMILLSSLFGDRDSTVFKVFAIASAVALVGLAPFFYKWSLRPVYTVTKSHLIINIRGQETAYPLTQVEPIIEGRHMYRINGKRMPLMISHKFLAHLNERLHVINRKNKRR